jgi:hypothetical protein
VDLFNLISFVGDMMKEKGLNDEFNNWTKICCPMVF